MKLRVALFLFLVCALASAQDGASLRVLPVEGLPDDLTITGYGILRTDALNRLVVESRNGEGVLSFHTLHHVDRKFTVRLTNSAGLPVVFEEPPAGTPATRSFSDRAGADLYWTVARELSPIAEAHYVTAVPLPARRFSDTAGAAFPELPPVAAGLAIDFVRVDAIGEVLSRCTLEPNLVRRGERMTAISAQWVRAQGRPHLLVGMGTDADDQPWPVFYRIYSPDLELVAQTEVLFKTDPNRFPRPVLHDLTGDGEDEIILFSTVTGGTRIVVLQPGPGAADGGRVLALNDCAARMNGNDVAAVQRALEREGFSVGRHGIDGWYGPDTRAAVVAFQRSAGLPPTGVVDGATRAALGRE